MANVNAQTAKTLAETEIISAQVPYSAQNAQVGSLKLDREFQLLGQQLEKAIADKDIAKLEANELKPLVIKYQQLVNEATQLGIPLKKAEAKFFENVPEAKWLMIVRQVLTGK